MTEKFPKILDEKSMDSIPKPTILSVILFSFFFSSGLSGVVYIAAFFFHGGNISRDIIAASISKISEGSEKIRQNR
jgi:hypothetical protein